VFQVRHVRNAIHRWKTKRNEISSLRRYGIFSAFDDVPQQLRVCRIKRFCVCTKSRRLNVLTLNSRWGNKLVHSLGRHYSFKSGNWSGFWYARLIGVQNVPLVHLCQVIQLESSKILENLRENKNKTTPWTLGSLPETFPANVGVMWNVGARDCNRHVRLKSAVLFLFQNDQKF